MKKTTIVLMISIILVSILVVSCGAPAATPEPTPDLSVGQALVESRCNTCHGLSNVKSATYSREVWTTTVDRMLTNGLSLNDQQKVDVVNYLSATYSE